MQNIQKEKKKPRISLFIFKDHLILYDENIIFDNDLYKNTYQYLKTLIKDRTIKVMTSNEKVILMSSIEKEDVIQVSLIVHSLDQI